MIAAGEFLGACWALGLGFVTGTPCSYLKPMIDAAIDDPDVVSRDATNEGDAVAIAGGGYIATGRPGRGSVPELRSGQRR